MSCEKNCLKLAASTPVSYTHLDVYKRQHKRLEDVHKKAESYNQRYGTAISYADGSTEANKQVILESVDVALCCAAVGVRVLTSVQIANSSIIKVIADVNAVAPTGAEGVEVMADGVAIGGTNVIGIGALAIGNLKYATQHNLLKQMLAAHKFNGEVNDKPCYLEFMAAFEMAQHLTRV